MLKFSRLLARPARFERATPGFGGQYSIQLSYGRLGERMIRPRRGEVQPSPADFLFILR
jgi:hypothetical protein